MNTEAPISPDLIDLRAQSVSLILVKRGSLYAYAYLGKSPARAEDVVALAPTNAYGGQGFCDPLQTTLPTFGGDCTSGMDPYGALAAMHADGVATTRLALEHMDDMDEGPGVRHIVLHLKDETHEFRIEQHFRAWGDCDVFETWIVLCNGENGPVSLSRMDSLGIDLRGAGRDVAVQTTSGQWAAEAQLATTRLGRGQTLEIGSRSGVRGAWENNPGFLVSLDADGSEDVGRALGCALAWSGAWEARVKRSPMDVLSLRSGVCNASGPYVLDPGRSITLPLCVLAYSEEGRGGVSRAFHRWARNHRMPHGRELRPVLLNSWEGAYFHFTEQTLLDMMDGVKSFGGEMFVVDDGWFGRGKFARNNDKVGLGDWCWNFEKLPRGVKFLADEAVARGLRFGLWFEPEMANTASALAEQHPDWIIRENDRPLRCGRGGSQVVLDMTNPAVRDAVFRQIADILDQAPNLTYIKWDANADFLNAGSAHLPADRQANLWFDYCTGVYDLLARLRRAYPHVWFQACSSGGAHADFGFLGGCDEFWGSDNTDARQRVFIQWGEMQVYPANATACHVTAVPNHTTGRTTPLKFRFDVAMSGRMGFELHPANLPKEDIPFVQRAVEFYKRVRPVVQQGDLYRLASPYDGDYASLMFVDGAKDRAVVFMYGLNRPVHANPVKPIRLRGLDPAKRYHVVEANLPEGARAHVPVDGQTLGGDALMLSGIPFALGPEYDSAVLELEAR